MCVCARTQNIISTLVSYQAYLIFPHQNEEAGSSTQVSQKITSAFLSILTMSLMFHFHTSVSGLQISTISFTVGHLCMTKLKITQKGEHPSLGYFQK